MQHTGLQQCAEIEPYSSCNELLDLSYRATHGIWASICYPPNDSHHYTRSIDCQLCDRIHLCIPCTLPQHLRRIPTFRKSSLPNDSFYGMRHTGRQRSEEPDLCMSCSSQMGSKTMIGKSHSQDGSQHYMKHIGRRQCAQPGPCMSCNSPRVPKYKSTACIAYQPARSLDCKLRTDQHPCARPGPCTPDTLSLLLQCMRTADSFSPPADSPRCTPRIDL